MVATTSAENRVLLHNISWQTFKTMLAEMGSERNSRFAYDNGTIEIMTPQMPHENSNRVSEGDSSIYPRSEEKWGNCYYLCFSGLGATKNFWW
ncbi:hypothetical protein ANSO36C_11410 [Nostoc cf. commune SO-36]|uniref:Uma2 family endonuclease n=1 Tax=Nostoc cf. commune SO-36 TaxID=449208 RepID=A0ABN6PY21_NOSCO|nr:hypothetical protein ANSO36C_11410 [Nostoc cf. commune SO-36]